MITNVSKGDVVWENYLGLFICSDVHNNTLSLHTLIEEERNLDFTDGTFSIYKASYGSPNYQFSCKAKLVNILYGVECE